MSLTVSCGVGNRPYLSNSFHPFSKYVKVLSTSHLYFFFTPSHSNRNLMCPSYTPFSRRLPPFSCSLGVPFPSHNGLSFSMQQILESPSITNRQRHSS